MAGLSIRARYSKPGHPQGLGASGDTYKVRLRHPGYPDSHNILLLLPALDGGIHHETARVACALLANARWDGFLSASPTGPPVDDGPDAVLPLPDYYFRLPPDAPSHDDRYPVVPDFASFSFPHQHLPPSWLSDSLRIARAENQPRESNYAAVALSRDISCRLTNYTLGTESAHLVPRAEESWFTLNSMFQYAAWDEKLSPDDPRNVMLLRSDIHTLFDARRFVIVPKQGVWVAHVLSGTAADELATLYHNVQLQHLEDVAVELLFARFAWAVFAHSTFVVPGVKRVLLAIRPGTLEQARLEMTGAQYEADFASRLGTKSKSQSPKKRIRDAAADDEAAVTTDGDESDGELRGRPRRRLYDDYTTATSSLASDARAASRSTSLSTAASKCHDLERCTNTVDQSVGRAVVGLGNPTSLR